MFKKPNQKAVTGQAATVGAGIVGASLSDGLVGLIPAQFSQYGKPAVALATAIASACVDNKSMTGKLTQGALAGASIKQGLDALREILAKTVTPQDATSTVGRFANQVMGLSSPDAAPVVVPKLNPKMFNRPATAPAQGQAVNSSAKADAIA